MEISIRFKKSKIDLKNSKRTKNYSVTTIKIDISSKQTLSFKNKQYKIFIDQQKDY